MCIHHCIVLFLLANVQFCWFDKLDPTANVHWHCNHWPPLWYMYHYFPAHRVLYADVLSDGGWSGGAMVLGKLPVPGRPTNLGDCRARAYCACGRGWFGHFYSLYPFSPLSPSLWETARYRLKYCLKRPLNPKQSNPIQSCLMDWKIIDMCHDFLHARGTPYPLGQALCLKIWISAVCVCVCIPILVKTFPGWLSCTEPLLHTPGGMCPSSLCL